MSHLAALHEVGHWHALADALSEGGHGDALMDAVTRPDFHLATFEHVKPRGDWDKDVSAQKLEGEDIHRYQISTPHGHTIIRIPHTFRHLRPFPSAGGNAASYTSDVLSSERHEGRPAEHGGWNISLRGGFNPLYDDGMVSNEFVAHHPVHGEVRGNLDANYLHGQTQAAVNHFNAHVHPENYEE